MCTVVDVQYVARSSSEYVDVRKHRRCRKQIGADVDGVASSSCVDTDGTRRTDGQGLIPSDGAVEVELAIESRIAGTETIMSKKRYGGTVNANRIGASIAHKGCNITEDGRGERHDSSIFQSLYGELSKPLLCLG